jgi:quercetin dioxygenase-like cupin family protein
MYATRLTDLPYNCGMPTNTTDAAALHCWDDVNSEEVAPGIHRRYVCTSRMTIARIHLARGGVVPMHSHDHEQMTNVLHGALLFHVGGREVTVRAGESLQIPSWVEHDVHAIEDSDVIDVFCPVRQDWVDGTDTYFRK